MPNLLNSFSYLLTLIKKPTTANILWLFFDKAFGALLTIYIYSKIAIYFGAELFGVWNYIISFSTIILALGGLGLNFVIVKRIKQNPLLTNIIITNTFWSRLLFGIVVACALLIIYSFIGVNINSQYILTIVFVFSSQVVLNANVFIFLNESNLKNKWTVINRNIALIFSFVLKLIAINFELSITYFALINLVELSLFFFLIKSIPKKPFGVLPSFKLRNKVIYPLLKESFPLLLAAVTVTLYLKIDQLIIAYLLNNESVGIYATASKLTEMLYALPVILSNVFFPKIIEKYKNKKLLEAKNVLNKLFGLTLVSTICLALFVSFFSDYIIRCIFGESYIKASGVLNIYAWSIVFMGLLVSSSKYLLAIKRNDIIFKREVLGLISNVILNFILIPRYNLYGAAWATLISYFIASYFSNVFFKDLRTLMKDQLFSIYYYIRSVWEIN